MKLGVVIPCFRQTASLLASVSSVRGSLIVVVDDSTDGGVAIPGVERVRTQGAVGFASAANTGLAYLEDLGCELALVLNDDAAMRPGALDVLHQAFSAGDGAIAPVLHEPEGPVFGIRVHRSGRIHLARKSGAVEALSGAAIMLRCAERFDSGFVHGFEDIELCERLSQRGLAVRVIDKAHCDHAAGGTVGRRTRQAQRAGMAGHLRWLGGGVLGGLRGGFAIGLNIAQVLKEGGPAPRFLGIAEGVADHLRASPRRH
jgi:GT2 family glycosyltransferase